MLVLYADPVAEAHATPPGHPECPDRYAAVARGLEATGLVTPPPRAASPASVDDLARVHDPGLVAAIERLAAGGGGSIDADTHVSARSFEAARAAAGTLCAAVDAALAAPPQADARRAFCVVRPPGHHARPAQAMGFCLFNNVAVAAARARAAGVDRVAIVDFDFHHGNGTQEAFYADPAVFYASLHHGRAFPGTGRADETGAGAGLGTTLNLPLAWQLRPADYQAAFGQVLERVVAFRPDLLLVSAGFDAYVDDPLGGLGLEAEHFQWIGARLREAADAACGGRVVSVLEGGYALEALGEVAGAYGRGLVQGAA